MIKFQPNMMLNLWAKAYLGNFPHYPQWNHFPHARQEGILQGFIYSLLQGVFADQRPPSLPFLDLCRLNKQRYPGLTFLSELCIKNNFLIFIYVSKKHILWWLNDRKSALVQSQIWFQTGTKPFPVHTNDDQVPYGVTEPQQFMDNDLALDRWQAIP